MWARIRQFFEYIIPGVIRPLRVLWNEIIGFVFAVFTVIFGFRTVKFFRDLEGRNAGELMLLLGMAAFTLMLALFCFSSFRRARRINRG